MLSGFPYFPDDAEVETWATIVGPALNEWLAELGFTYDSSQRWQFVVWDRPERMAEFRGPGAPDFEKES